MRTLMRVSVLLLSFICLWSSLLMAEDKSPVLVSRPVYESITVDEVARIFFSIGLTATRGTSKVGNVLLISRVNGYDFEVDFYNCDGDGSCQDIQFGLKFTGVSGALLERMNNWNAQYRLTRAYLDDKDPVLEMDIHIGGGVTETNLKQHISIWRKLAPKFVEFLRTGSL